MKINFLLEKDMRNQSKKIILEKRFNLFDKIKKYVRPDGQVEYFIHFTDIEGKLGLNPQSNFQTPIGVYGYILNPTIYDDFANGSLEFASDRPYISIGRIKSDGDRKIGVFGYGVAGQYSEKDLIDDSLKLYPIFLKLYNKKPQDFLGRRYKNNINILKDTTNLIKNVSRVQEALNSSDENVVLYTLEELNKGLWRSYSSDFKHIADMLYRASSDYLYDTGHLYSTFDNEYINRLYDFHKILRLVRDKIAKVKVDYITSRNKEELENLDVDSLDKNLLPQTLPIAKSAFVSLYDNLIDISKTLSSDLQPTQNPLEIYEELKEEAFEGAKQADAQTKFWNLTRLLAQKYSSIIGTKSLIAWTKILMDIGYGGFVDYETGTIHENEPSQTVLFPGNYEFVEQLKNVSRNEKEINALKSISNIFRKINNKSDFSAIKNILINFPHNIFFNEFLQILRDATSSLKKMPNDYVSTLLSLINDQSSDDSIILALNIILFALRGDSLSENQAEKVYEQLKDFDTNHYTIDKLKNSILIQITQKVDSLNEIIFNDLIKYDNTGDGEFLRSARDFKYITEKDLIRKVILDDGYDFSKSTKAVLLSSVKFTDKDDIIEILRLLKSKKLIKILISKNRELIYEDLVIPLFRIFQEKGLDDLIIELQLYKYPLSNEVLNFFEDSIIKAEQNMSSSEFDFYMNRVLNIILGNTDRNFDGFKFSEQFMEILLKVSLSPNVIIGNIMDLSEPKNNSVVDIEFFKDLAIKILDLQDETGKKNSLLSKSLYSLINYSINNKLDQEYIDIFMAILYELDVLSFVHNLHNILKSRQLLTAIIDNDGKYVLPEKKWDLILKEIITNLANKDPDYKITLDDLEKIKPKTSNEKLKKYVDNFKSLLKEGLSRKDILHKFIDNVIKSYI
jgi:hypothetical protein